MSAEAIEPKKPRKPPVAKAEKAEKVEKETCSICADHYTAILRRKVVCKFCSKDTCSKCVEQYLLSRHEDAHCLHCRVNYSDEVLRQSCTKTYLQQTYFQHRQMVLMNRHRAQLPTLQEEAVRIRHRKDREAIAQGVRLEIVQLKHEKDELMKEYSLKCTEHYQIVPSRAENEAAKMVLEQRVAESRKELDAIMIQADKLRTEIMMKKEVIFHLRHERYEPEAGAAAAASADDKKEEERKRFIRRCTHDDCKGFLSNAWKCGMCEWYSCSKCFMVKGDKHDSPHECTKEDIETADLIRKNCKPCPKCGEQIEHGGGCSQMWCITCQTPWDWNTGKIVTSGPLHNPLYYEWLRRTGGNVQRNPADVPCGGFPRAWELVRMPRGMLPHVADKFREFHRICQELQDISQHQYQTHIDNTTINAIHIRLLLQEIDEKQWGRYLAINEKKRKRDTEVQEVFGAFRMVAVELINRVHRYSDKKYRSFTDVPTPFAEQFINDLFIEIQELIRMINDAFRTISIAHSYSVPSISVRNDDKYTEYFVTTTKFAEEKKKRSTKEATVTSEASNVSDVPSDDEKEDLSANSSANSSVPHRDRIVSRPLVAYQHDSDSDLDINDVDDTDPQTQDILLQVYEHMRDLRV
jgi:hypothetical protein